MTPPLEDRAPLGIAVLGSTGSVGRQTLDVIAAHPDRFQLIGIAARRLSDRLLNQVRTYAPLIAGASAPSPLEQESAGVVWCGPDALLEIVTHPAVDIVVVATSGHAAIEPTIAAIEHGKTIALANKETLVCAGEIIMPLARRHSVEIRPVDSEHSAVWQALNGEAPDQIEKVILTASGGPFRDTPLEMLEDVSIADALSHPTWSMGGKITVDSASMMNKGLEIIEAHWLFDMPYDRIDVLVHPESIVHSLVEFADGGLIAQLGQPDMRLPIQYALTYPDRIPNLVRRLRLSDVGTLRFFPADERRFPALRLAREAGVAGATYPTALSAADEVAVEAFLSGELRFPDIVRVAEQVLHDHQPVRLMSLAAIAETDAWARRRAHEIAQRLQ